MKSFQFLKDYYRNNSKFLLLSILLFFGSLYLFWEITDEIILENDADFDNYVFSIFKNFIVQENLNQTVKVITNLSASDFMIYFFPGLVTLLFLFKQRSKAIFLFVTGTGGFLLFSGLKFLFQRERPPYPLLFEESGFSFPSGHATFSFVFYGSLAYLVWLAALPKILKIMMMVFLLTLSLAIGISRIYLRVHYPSDVLAGFCLGYSWLLLMIYISRKWYPLPRF